MFWNQVLIYKFWGLDDSAVSGKVLLRLPLHKLMNMYVLLERPGFCLWAWPPCPTSGKYRNMNKQFLYQNYSSPE